MSNPLRSRRFDLIAFDWGGTLYDSTQIIVRCIQSAVVDVGGQKPTDEQAAYVIGMALMPALAHAAPDVPKEKYPMLGERYLEVRYEDLCGDFALTARRVLRFAGVPAAVCALGIATEMVVFKLPTWNL